MKTKKFKRKTEEYREKLPKKMKPIFMKLIDNNFSPKKAFIGIHYCIIDKTQKEVSKEYNVSENMVRESSQTARILIEEVPDIEVKINTRNKLTKIEIQKEIIDRLDLRGGSFNNDYSGNIKEGINFKKSAFEKILKKLRNYDEDN